MIFDVSDVELHVRQIPDIAGRVNDETDPAPAGADPLAHFSSTGNALPSRSTRRVSPGENALLSVPPFDVRPMPRGTGWTGEGGVAGHEEEQAGRPVAPAARTPEHKGILAHVAVEVALIRKP